MSPRRPRWLEAGLRVSLAALLCGALAAPLASQAPSKSPEGPTGADFVAYTEAIELEGRVIELPMVPVPGGRVALSDGAEGSREIEVAPFWMSAVEIPWDLYRVFQFSLDLEGSSGVEEAVGVADAVARPTPPYTPMDFGMGVEGYPAIAMTQLGARLFSKWLSRKTQHDFRLPSEAEWVHACRLGRATSEGGGSASEAPDDWLADVSDGAYRPVGSGRPDRLGIHDLGGNVAEWTLDQYVELAERDAADGIVWPSEKYPRVVRGASYIDSEPDLACTRRRASTPVWQRRDPQFPKSVWYLTDAAWVGLRVIRPYRFDSTLAARYWDPDVESDRSILESQANR